MSSRRRALHYLLERSSDDGGADCALSHFRYVMAEFDISRALERGGSLLKVCRHVELANAAAADSVLTPITLTPLRRASCLVNHFSHAAALLPTSTAASKKRRALMTTRRMRMSPRKL